MKVTNKNGGFLLTVLVSSLFLPVSSSPSFWTKDILTTPEVMQAVMMEYITVGPGGTCTLYIVINVSSSFLVDIYKRAFGYNSSYINGNLYSVPENISVVRDQRFTWNEVDDVYEDPGLDVNGRIYPRDSLCNGIFQQQLLCLGIEITSFSSVEMKYNGSVFFAYINANGFFVQYQESGADSTVCVGPSNWNMSCDRANLVLTEIGFIQQMIGEYSGEQIYHNNWITEITTTTAINNPLDIPNYWIVDFGGGTSIEATSSLLGNTVTLVEDLWVSEENITKTEHQLLEEERFLCYKIFNIKYVPVLGCCVSRSACVDDLTWGFDLPSFTIACPPVGVKFSDPDGKVSVDFRFEFSLTVTGHVQLKTKWFKFRKFEAWLQAEGMLWAKFNASYTGTFWEKTWERDLCEWTTNQSRPYTFWVGPVLVVVRPRIRIIARLYVKFEGTVWISCEARTDGLIRLGAGWKRHKGFYGIFKAGMTVTEFKPDYGGNVEVTVTPSVGFRPSLLFYETVGPAVELEPYLEVHWFDHGGGNWDNDTLLGINVSVGIDFSGWIKKITGLDDYDWTIFDWVLWEYPNREQHDVAVTDVRIPPETVYKDTMNVSVFVLNVGKSDETNIEVTLYYHDGSGWVKFDCVQNPKLIDLSARDYATVDFTCYTEGMTYTDDPGGTPYPVKAEAVIDPDNDDSNNRCTGEFNLTYLNVAIISLTSYWNAIRFKYKIDVVVWNTGTTKASAVPIFMYDNGEPISDVWCEAMTIMFDLQPKELRISTLYSDTSDSLTAEIPLLLYETITGDNIWTAIGREDVDVALSPITTVTKIEVGLPIPANPGICPCPSPIEVDVARLDSNSNAAILVVIVTVGLRTETSGDEVIIGIGEATLGYVGGTCPTTATLSFYEFKQDPDAPIEPGTYTVFSVVLVVSANDTNTANNIFEQTSSVEVGTLPGDINVDCIIDMADISMLIDWFMTYPGHPDWDIRGDIIKDDIIDMADISMIIVQFMYWFCYL